MVNIIRNIKLDLFKNESIEMNAQIEQCTYGTSQTVPKLAVRDANVSMVSSRLARNPALSLAAG